MTRDQSPGPKQNRNRSESPLASLNLPPIVISESDAYSRLWGGSEVGLTSGRWGGGAFAALSHVGTPHPAAGGRVENEDAYVIVRLPGGELGFTLADGHKSRGGGALAAATILESAARTFREGHGVSLVLPHAAEALEAKYDTLPPDIRPAFRDMGASVAALKLRYNPNTKVSYLQTAHTGDSRIMYLSRGRVRFETVDDTLAVQELYKQTKERRNVLISDLAGGLEDLRHVVTGQIGLSYGANNSTDPFHESDPLRLRRHDMVLVASDGLTGVLETEEVAQEVYKIRQRLRGQCSPEQITEALVQGLYWKTREVLHSVPETDFRFRLDNFTVLAYLQLT